MSRPQSVSGRIAEGTVTITEQGEVTIHNDIWKLKSTPKLNQKL